MSHAGGSPAPGANKTALLVVDVQVGVMANAWEAPRVEANIVSLVQHARDAGAPVVWVQHSDADLKQGSDEWKLIPQLTPQANEAIVQKHYNSSFEETELDRVLGTLGAKRIVLAGAATNWCIRATAYGALDRGYDLTLVSDAHTTESIEFQNGTVISAETIVSELNVGMKWISYPRSKVTVMPAAEISF
ncbi:MAG: cysteine hydrolase family protein [Candidatus Eisenbacteria bacterium]